MKEALDGKKQGEEEPVAKKVRVATPEHTPGVYVRVYVRVHTCVRTFVCVCLRACVCE